MLHRAREATGLVVIIDVFRAFTTACYVADRSPAAYYLLTASEAAASVPSLGGNPLLVGKAELGVDLGYHIPNSPTLARAVDVEGRAVLHRSGAGAKGVLAATAAHEIITGSFVNAAAVARYIRRKQPPRISIVPMGHEAGTPSLEDDLCAACIAALVRGERFDLSPHLDALRTGPGKYFFEGAAEYPAEDFDRCLERDRFDFVLQATLRGDYAELRRLDPDLEPTR